MKYYTYICPHYTYPLNRFVMKLKLILASVMLIGLTFSGCEKIKSLLDVHFNTHFSVDKNVVVPDVNSNITFDATTTINPKDDADVAKYGNLIKSFDITKAMCSFTNVSESFTLVSFDVIITSGSESTTWHFSNLSIINGTEISLPNTNGQWDTANLILGSLNPFTVRVTGESDKGNISFNFKTELDATVTANPLGSK